ncbi:MAG: hypothetical protein IKP74_07225 [Clostridia bacterium]|nr:hypothetical protein [Clostridia bacterium]
MNYTSNRTYFKPRRALGYVGGAFCLLAVPAFFIVRVMAIFPLIIGVLCLFVNRELNVRGTDVEEQIRTETDRLSAELEDKHYDVKHPYPKMMITVVGDYVTEGEGLLFRRSSLGKNITSRYHVAAIGTKNGRLYYSEERFSTVDDSDYSSSEGEFDFSELDRVDYGPAEGAAVPHSEFALIKRNGEEVFRVPAPTDYTTEKYVEDLNAIFTRAHAEEGQKDKPE